MTTSTGSSLPPPQTRPHLDEKVHDSRASSIPCPMLSILVMEEKITPDIDGNVHLVHLKQALEGLGLNWGQRTLLSHHSALTLEGDRGAPINLYRLAGSVLDHKGSLGPIQEGGFNPQHMEHLRRCSSDGVSLTIEDLGAAQARRMRAERGQRRDKLLGRVEVAALMALFGTTNARGERAISLADITTIFQFNRLPASFRRRPVSSVMLAIDMVRLARAARAADQAGR